MSLNLIVEMLLRLMELVFVELKMKRERGLRIYDCDDDSKCHDKVKSLSDYPFQKVILSIIFKDFKNRKKERRIKFISSIF
jgi:hypothetical protein